MKICLVCSHGGHFTETMQILEAFDGHELVFATYHSSREAEVAALGRAYFTENIGASVRLMFLALFWALRILHREKPDLIVSLGAEIALPFMYWGKLLRIKTVFIESWCRVEDLSKTGRLVYPVADVFWVQWPQLLAACGRKAEYKGAVI
ncbi:MAG TPA: PssD/Cps14F family polysaccharide biosynthesis glycosyltransferase [Chloroflexota bacterium]|nr:PssD/Cps14F family polysaccharide biosynthesis glycosyltransferase [Chloroflexota bacterium]HUM67374.1 PssD/Cps14F family polysaccharide biosynthesis glycosyltransferase [Chloroflexota bacterium]